MFLKHWLRMVRSCPPFKRARRRFDLFDWRCDECGARGFDYPILEHRLGWVERWARNAHVQMSPRCTARRVWVKLSPRELRPVKMADIFDDEFFAKRGILPPGAD